MGVYQKKHFPEKNRHGREGRGVVEEDENTLQNKGKTSGEWSRGVYEEEREG
jgi:hypothetical protein